MMLILKNYNFKLWMELSSFDFWIICNSHIEFLDCDWNWNVKGWIPLALSSSSTSLGVFSFASFLHSKPQKPSPFCPSLPAEKRICHLCHRIYMTLNKQRSNPFSWQEPSSFALFVFHHSWPHHLATSWLATIPPSQYDLVVAKKSKSVFLNLVMKLLLFGPRKYKTFCVQNSCFGCKIMLWLQNYVLVANIMFWVKELCFVVDPNNLRPCSFPE